MKIHKLAVISALIIATTAAAFAGAPMDAPDLFPVKMQAAPTHAPVELVRQGQPRAVIYLGETTLSDTLRLLAQEMVETIRLSTGATLPIVLVAPPADQPAIVIGDCAETRKAGIDARKIPMEGFIVKTAPNRVYLVGSTQPLGYDATQAWHTHANDGTAWAVADLLERFVGVRWYWALEAGGRTLVNTDTLTIPPINYSDQPVFRLRNDEGATSYSTPFGSRWFDKQHPKFPLPDTTVLHIPILYLRAGNSWPYKIKVHEPQGQKYWHPKEWLEAHRDMFATNKDGTPNWDMWCYSSPMLIAYLLDGCKAWDQGKVGASWATINCVTVSPPDAPLSCYCERCAKYFDGRVPDGPSARMAEFVNRFAAEVKTRWPEKKVLFLPYWNYTLFVDGSTFPDNLEIQSCNLYGMAALRQESARARMEKSFRGWNNAIHGKITTWEYSLWVTDWTHAPMQYPHVVVEYYRRNRDILAGSFINPGMVGEWTKTAPSLYIWTRALWNPDINVDATLDEMCKRLFGKASGTTRQLLQLMTDRWEKATWSEPLGGNGRMSDTIFCETWPPDVVATMIQLRQQARAELNGDDLGRLRLDYWLWTFDAFVQEAKDRYKAKGLTYNFE